MNNNKSFSYLDAVKYIGNKWSTELWQYKYILIPTIVLTYIKSTVGEEEKFQSAQKTMLALEYGRIFM